MPSDSDTSVPLQINTLECSPEQHSPGLLSHIITIGHVTFFFFKGSIFFKVFIEFVTILFLFYTVLTWSPGLGSQLSEPGNKPATPAGERE